MSSNLFSSNSGGATAQLNNTFDAKKSNIKTKDIYTNTLGL